MNISPRFGKVSLLHTDNDGTYQQVILQVTQAERKTFKGYTIPDTRWKDRATFQYLRPTSQKWKGPIWAKFQFLGEKHWRDLCEADQSILNKLFDAIAIPSPKIKEKIQTLQRELKESLQQQIHVNQQRLKQVMNQS